MMETKKGTVNVRAVRNGFVLTSSIGVDYVANDEKEAANVVCKEFIEIFNKMHESQEIKIDVIVYGTE